MFEILSIATVVFTGVLILLLLQKLLPEDGRLLKNISGTLLVLYIFVILYETLLFRPMTGYVSYKLSLFWSYRQALSIGRDSSSLRLWITDPPLLKQIILNILLYIPFGYLLPLARPKWIKPLHRPVRQSAGRVRQRFPWIVVFAGTLLSAGIELVQLLFRLGLFELDDIFNNTLGCLIGVVLYWLLLRPQADHRE